MTFQWLNKQGVRSPDGFEVQFVGRFELEYRENGRSIVFGIEDLCGVPGIRFFESWRTARWQDGSVPISSEDLERIKANLTDALSFMDLRAEFD